MCVCVHPCCGLQRLTGVSGDTHTHTHPFDGPLSGTTQLSRYQKGETNLDFTEARDSEWQWHQLGHMQVCTSLQINNHASTPPLSFLQAGCPSCRPTNSVKARKARVSGDSAAEMPYQLSRRGTQQVLSPSGRPGRSLLLQDGR